MEFTAETLERPMEPHRHGPIGAPDDLADRRLGQLLSQ
jgi:hypothetical protein